MTEQGDQPQAVDCSVLVPVLNEERFLVASVEAMRRQRFPGRLEFVLVDGGSTDRTPELLDRLAATDGRVRVLENPGGLTPRSLNIALRQARGRWVARMDAHTQYPADYLARGVERLRRGDTRWVSGPQVAIGSNSVSRAVALALGTTLGRGGSRKWGSPDDDGAPEYDLDSGVFAGVWERQTLLEYGGWDERWPRNQDSELAGRFLADGERLICIPAMGARYTPRGTLKSLWRQYLDYGEFRVKTARRHPNTMRRSHLIAPGLVVVAVAAVWSPRASRAAARAGLTVYAAAVIGAGIRAAGEADRPQDAALVPAVLTVMHFAHGVGVLRGAMRYGVPAAAIAESLGFTRLARRLAPSRELVYAPALSSDGVRVPA
jgi:glycosyltransferase involved in cell wall biosynthesis